MKSKLFGLMILFSLLGSLSGAGSVLAQSPLPQGPTPVPPGPQGPYAPGPETGMRFLSQAGAPGVDMSAQALKLGPSGLSFRYLKTFGKSGVAYLADHSHLNYPWGLGSQGNNIWIGELWGNRALRYNNSGVFQKQIGTAGDPDLPDTSLSEIADVATDGVGNIWVVDDSNSHVAKFNSSGTFLKELGVIYESGTDNSHFGYPVSIAFDGSENIYVSDGTPWWTEDEGNQRVQIFNSAGNYRATIGVTGEAGSTNNHFHGPRHITIYGNQLYVADGGNHRVQIFDITNPSIPTYVATLGVAGAPGSNNAHFNEPSGVAVDTDYIYVADTNNNRVQVFNRTTRLYVKTIGGTWGTANNRFEHPSDVAVDASHKLYIADFINQRVQQFTHVGATFTYARTFGVTGVPYLTNGSHFNNPRGVAVAGDGSIYLTEDMGNRLVKLNASGIPLWTVGAPGVKGGMSVPPSNLLSNPHDVAVDSTHVYVADTWDNRVRIYNPSNGAYIATIGNLGCPEGVYIAPSSYLYIADDCDSTVKIYNSSRSLVATMGVSGHSGSDNAHFNSPQDVSVDGYGTIYVADSGNHRVQVFNSSRTYVHTIGVTGNCRGDFAHFCNPSHLFVDAANRLYVADDYNNRIQVFDASGAYLTTIAGNWGRDNSNLRSPRGVAVDAAGNVYVADSGNNRIQKFGLGVPNWTQSNINGFGDRWSTDAEELATFNGQLYAAGSGDGTQIWRTSDGKTWSALGTTSFGDANNIGIDQLTVFNGKLYASTWNCTNSNCTTSNGGQVWRTDGTTWSKVVSGGFGSTNNIAVNALAVFSSQIYAATSAIDGKMQIYRSSTGNLGSWSAVMSNGFGGNGVWSDVTMAVYGSHLYVGLGRNPGIAELWRCHTCNGTDWSPVFTNGLGNTNNNNVRSLAVFNGTLYVGIRNMSQGGEVWKSTNGTSFTKVFGGGLGNVSNGRPDGLYVSNGYMYIVFSNTVKGTQVWRTPDGTHWTQVGFAGWGDANNTYADYMNKGAAAFGGRLYIGTYNWGNGGEVWSTLIP